MPINTRSISVYGTAINFTVDRSPRRRNISIEINPGDQAVVKAPLRVADSEIEQIVRKNAKWILAKLGNAKNWQPANAPRKYADGEAFFYLGDTYILKLIEASTQFPVGEVMLEHGNIMVSAFMELATTDPVSAVRDPLFRWYKKQAENCFAPRAIHFAKLFDVDVNQVLIRDQKRRWGSCNAKGELRFCYRLIMAPPGVIDYVVAHEVCHLREMNHSAAYWNTLGKVMPDYRARRHELKRIGESLVL